MLYTPKKFKFKKKHKGKIYSAINKIVLFETLNFKSLYLTTTNFGKLNSKQIEAMKQTITKIIKKNGQLKINIFPNVPVSKKPLETRMGKGKGNVDHWIVKIKIGTILCELKNTQLTLGLKALQAVQFKLPIETKIIYN